MFKTDCITHVLCLVFVSTVAQTASLLTNSRICDPGTGYCYKAYETSVNYQDAWYQCHSNDMFLAMPKTQDEIDFIQSNITGGTGHPPVWIGLSDYYLESDWRWQDRTHLNDTNIQPWKTGRNDEPFDSRGNDEDCVEIQDRGWNNAVCSLEKYYLCQDYTNVCNSSSPYHYRGICFKLFIGRYTYDNAKSKCITDGGYLAMPKTSDVNNYIDEINFGDVDIWYGLYAVLNRPFYWVDRDNLTYNTNALPTVATGEDRFVYMGNGGNWYLDYRIAEKSLVCMYETTITTTPPPTPTRYTRASSTLSSTSSSQTQSSTDALHGYCVCSNNSTNDDFTADYFRSLLIDKFSLSKYKRQFNSASDDRLSAKCLGVTGVFVIVTVACIIGVNDLLNAFCGEIFKLKRRTNKVSPETRQEKEWERIVYNLFNNNL